MTDLRGGGWATPSEELTALALEARRQGVSYGRLVANTDRWDLKEIIRAYCAEKNGRGNAVKKLKLWLANDRHFRWILLLLDLITIGMCGAWMAVLLRVLEAMK